MKLHTFSKFTYSALLSSIFLVTSPQGIGATPSPQKEQGITQSSATQSNSMWTTLSSRFALQDSDRVEVDAQIRWLQKNKTSLYRSLKTAAPYIAYVFNQTQKHGVPAELALLPIVESQFNPQAASPKGATGIWQLMPKTASALGIKVTATYDGRRDIVASTQAALNYLNSLHKMLSQDWLLALAAYNYGPGNIRSALKQIKFASFWNLKKLPKETQNYVPKLLALAAVIKDPAKYNIQLPPTSNNVGLTTVKLGAKVSLQDVAKKSGISTETMRQLNPGYTTMTTDHDTPNTVLLPVDSSQVAEPQSIAVTAAATPSNKHAHLIDAILKEGQWLTRAMTNIPQA